MQKPAIKIKAGPKKERAYIDDIMRFKNIYYRVRKITKKDVLLRPLTDAQAKIFLEKKGHKQ